MSRRARHGDRRGWASRRRERGRWLRAGNRESAGICSTGMSCSTSL